VLAESILREQIGGYSFMTLFENPALSKVGSGAKQTLGGFKAFILRGNVVDLAVGIVIGAAFTNVVNAVVSGLITPLIGLFGGFDFSRLNAGRFAFGTVINSLISFLIVAAVLYFLVVLPTSKLMALHKKGVPTETSTRDCPYCLSSIPTGATRCPYCTSQLEPVPPTAASAAS
jgi:large conductance mechanosensitive channel